MNIWEYRWHTILIHTVMDVCSVGAMTGTAGAATAAAAAATAGFLSVFRQTVYNSDNRRNQQHKYNRCSHFTHLSILTYYAFLYLSLRTSM